MCTLTYIPLKDEVVFTSNRDEHVSRADTQFPVIEERKGSKIYFPQDPQAGGTWLASSDSQRVSILLNGAFKAHKHLPPYRKSRGIILLDTFDYPSLDEFKSSYSLADIEPFTIVSYNMHKHDIIEELRWDGENVHFKVISAKEAHIWSSAQLYSTEIRKRRETWFKTLITDEISANKLIEFHEFGEHSDQQNNIKIDRGFGFRTISISQLLVSKEKTKFNYHNLVSGIDRDITIDNK